LIEESYRERGGGEVRDRRKEGIDLVLIQERKEQRVLEPREAPIETSEHLIHSPLHHIGSRG
jgi:hypothetical protein